MSLFNKFILNAAKPRKTLLGTLMLNGMNKGHNKMALWCMDDCLKPAGTEDILDIGCGGGQNIANFLQRTSGRVCGIDYSAASVAKSLSKNRKAVTAGRAQITEAGVTQIPFDNEMFDIVSAFETVYFWPDIVNSFKEVKRVLKPKGRFVVCNEASKLDGNERWTNILDMNIYQPAEIRELIQQAGFSEIKIFTKQNSQRFCVVASI